ncbi:hypothetical protein MNBD_GAMMA12-3168 [hydrothermal vent metagenome]|uniref:Tyr recombinase domain-containing protein n=1 Tax=hydrothermal vent metagenome TaxID=652676 RepID=A0A3B0YWI0_9ZZZZ
MTNSEVNYRHHAMSLEHYQRIVEYIGRWHLNIIDGQEKSYRYLLTEFILLLANTGLRFSEARSLRWKDVNIVDTPESPMTQEALVVEIDIVNSISGSRYLVGCGGGIITRIKQLSNFTAQNDYVFANDSAEKIESDIYFKLWQEVLVGAGLKQAERQYEYCSLRYSYANWRLYAGVDVDLISQVMGITVETIRKRYGHINLQYRSAAAMFDVVSGTGRVGF